MEWTRVAYSPKEDYLLDEEEEERAVIASCLTGYLQNFVFRFRLVPVLLSTAFCSTDEASKVIVAVGKCQMVFSLSHSVIDYFSKWFYFCPPQKMETFHVKAKRR